MKIMKNIKNVLKGKERDKKEEKMGVNLIKAHYIHICKYHR
jgi:hypothetical protein